MKKKYDCEIDCANCAAEVQDAISKINGVQSAKVNFLERGNPYRKNH